MVGGSTREQQHGFRSTQFFGYLAQNRSPRRIVGGRSIMAAHQSNQREKEIFERALDLESAEERLGYVKGACAEDAALLARVRALLQAHDEASRFLPDAPGAEERPTLVVPVQPTEGPGTVIDRYKLLQEIGEGGMGVVY